MHLRAQLTIEGDVRVCLGVVDGFDSVQPDLDVGALRADAVFVPAKDINSLVNGGGIDIGAFESKLAPTVRKVTVNGGAAQRSRVTSVTRVPSAWRRISNCLRSLSSAGRMRAITPRLRHRRCWKPNG